MHAKLVKTLVSRVKVVLRGGLCHSPQVVVPGDGDGDAVVVGLRHSPRLLPRGRGEQGSVAQLLVLLLQLLRVPPLRHVVPG